MHKVVDATEIAVENILSINIVKIGLAASQIF
jgi:hypothetical protein